MTEMGQNPVNLRGRNKGENTNIGKEGKTPFCTRMQLAFLHLNYMHTSCCLGLKLLGVLAALQHVVSQHFLLVLYVKLVIKKSKA